MLVHQQLFCLDGMCPTNSCLHLGVHTADKCRTALCCFTSCIIAGNVKPLSLDLAIPLIRQKKSQASYNPINALKEAADRQKVSCRHLESSVPQPAGSHPVFKHEITWEGQVSFGPHLVCES